MSGTRSAGPGRSRVILFVANSAKIGGGNRVLMDLIRGLDCSRYTPALVSPDAGPLTDWAADQGLRPFVCRHGDWQGSFELARRSVPPVLHRRVVVAEAP